MAFFLRVPPTHFFLLFSHSFIHSPEKNENYAPTKSLAAPKKWEGEKISWGPFLCVSCEISVHFRVAGEESLTGVILPLLYLNLELSP